MSALRDQLLDTPPTDTAEDNTRSSFFQEESTAATVKENHRLPLRENKRVLRQREYIRKSGISTEQPRLDSAQKNDESVSESQSASGVGRFIVLRQYEGTVTHKEAGEFWARLVTLNAHQGDEEAEFSLEEVPEYDHDLGEPGAVFYWTIGFSDSPAGSRTRASMLRFRRLPVWGDAELEKAKINAKRLAAAFGAEPNDHEIEQQRPA